MDRRVIRIANRNLAAQNAYGIISVQNGVTAQEDIGPTPKLLTAWNTDGLYKSMAVSSADNYITATKQGAYAVSCSLSFSGTGSSLVNARLYIYDQSADEWTDSGYRAQRKLGNGGDVGACGLVGIVNLDVNDRVAIFVTTDGASDDITVAEAQLMATM